MRKGAAPAVAAISDTNLSTVLIIEALTELSNLARLRRPPSTMLSRLISVLPICSLGFPEEEPGALSPLL